MFKLILIFSLAVSAFANDEACDLDPSEKLTDLSDDAIKIACAQFEAENKCEEMNISTEQKKINPESLADQLIRSDKAKLKDSSIINLSNAVMAEDKSMKKDVLESKLRSKIIEFVKVRKCEPTFRKQNLSLDTSEFGGKIAYKNSSDKQRTFNELVKKGEDPDFKKKFLEKHSKNNQQHFYSFLNNNNNIKDDEDRVSISYCSNNLMYRTMAKPRQPYPKCVGSVSKYFQDNKAILNEETDAERLKAQQEITSCIKQYEEAGFKVTSVKINSSANKLRNTSTIEEIRKGIGFCGFDFLGLSKARAEFAKNKILPQIPGIDSKVKIEVNANGADGDGTSGPCPYDRHGKLKPEYSGAGKKELDQHKATDIEVEFEPINKRQFEAAASEGGIHRWSSACEAFYIDCK